VQLEDSGAVISQEFKAGIKIAEVIGIGDEV